MIVISYDDLDASQGNYFSFCASELKNNLPPYFSDKLELIFGQNLNSVFIELSLSKLNQAPFIFSAFCHGTTSSLNAKNLPFLKARENTQLLKNSIVYTNACSSAKDFGLDVIEEGAIAFVGYNEDVDSLISESFMPLSVRCDNYALYLFLHGNLTLSACVKAAKKWFTNRSRKISRQNPFAAAILVKNRDALVIYGNENIMLSDVFNFQSP